MQEFKVCQYCGRVPISNLRNSDTDYYRHISVKYCDTCREIVKKKQTAERVKALRQRRREENALIRTQNELLKQENELIRQNIDDYMYVMNYIRQHREEFEI